MLATPVMINLKFLLFDVYFLFSLFYLFQIGVYSSKDKVITGHEKRKSMNVIYLTRFYVFPYIMYHINI